MSFDATRRWRRFMAKRLLRCLLPRHIFFPTSRQCRPELTERRICSVSISRNRITGGGVTAGIDFGLVVLAKLRGDDAAKFTQLAMEYDPEPPFNSGSPKTADPAIVQQTLSTMAIYMEQLASNPGTVSRVE